MWYLSRPESAKVMLAQIEKGTANPSLGVLGKITSGLRIRFQELIQAPASGFLPGACAGDGSYQRGRRPV